MLTLRPGVRMFVGIDRITLGSVVAGVANQGDIDIFAMKFSPSGELLSVWEAGTSKEDELTSVAVDHCGNVFVGRLHPRVVGPRTRKRGWRGYVRDEVSSAT